MLMIEKVVRAIDLDNLSAHLLQARQPVIAQTLVLAT